MLVFPITIASNSGSSSVRAAFSRIPAPPCMSLSFQESRAISHIFVAVCTYSSLRLYKSRRLEGTYTKSSTRAGAILFHFKEWMNLYVLQFLSAHEDEQGCPRSLRARVWRVGNAEPWYCHQTKGCKAHLFVKAPGEGNLPLENVANSNFTTINSFSSSRYRSKHLLLSIEISWSQRGGMRFGFPKSHSME